VAERSAYWAPIGAVATVHILPKPHSILIRRCFSFLQLRATTSLAQLWRDQGKRAEAYALLAPIYGWFTEGFDVLDLKDAKALLDELA
jgi:hypothetical protein